MPALLAFFWGSFSAVMGTLVGRVLVSLGLTYVTYTGLSGLLTWAKNAFVTGMNGLPAEAVGIAYTMQVDVCVSMLLSAVTARLVMSGLSAAGSLTKIGVKAL